MPDKVGIRIVEGPLAGQSFSFEEHGVLLFGRDPKCHVNLPDDKFISRHHLVFDINPPIVQVRDLNSLNGTIINGVRYGGRTQGTRALDSQSIEPIALINGDRIQVGQTVMIVEAEQAPKSVVMLTCTMCGRNVSGPDQGFDGADYLCETCSAEAELQPDRFLKTMLKQGITVVGHGRGGDFANYKVGNRLDAGGMGSVFLAESREDGSKVVLKVLHSKLAANRQNRETFLREMLLLRSLKHENIVQYRDYGSVGNTFFFAVEYCNGGTLAQCVARSLGQVPWRTALPYFRQVLEGLAHAHAKNVVHRDIKPENIFLHTEGETATAKIGDFGLAKVFTLANMTRLTKQGEYAGSFLFMARDQLVDFKFARPVTDIWSVAATFYNVLTGKYPREWPAGKDPIDVIMEDAIRPIEYWETEMPPQLAAAINRGLSSAPERRWQSAAAFLDAIDGIG